MERVISTFLWQSTKLPKLMAQLHSTLVAMEKLDKLEKDGKINMLVWAQASPEEPLLTRASRTSYVSHY